MVTRNLRFRFTLVSYNILAQSLLHDHSYLYNNCNPYDLEWPRRGHRIIRELINDRADIICLQEVESDHLQSLYRPRLARYGYECLYKKKTGYKLDGCAIFYKSNLFHLSNFKGVEFNRTDVAYLLDRDNVGLIAVLKPRIPTRSESSHLVIANTHLIFNPKRCDIKLAQLKYFLSELEAISRKLCDSNNSTTLTSTSTEAASSSDPSMASSYHPTILCGDLNSTPNSEVISYIMKNLRPLDISNGQLNRSNQCMSNSSENEGSNPRNSEVLLDSMGQSSLDSSINEELGHARLKNYDIARDVSLDLDSFEHSLKFKSTYPTHNRVGQRYVSTFSSDIVDYIFYTPALRLESYKELLTEDQLDEIGSLPNSKFPSDHIMLGAKFTLK